MLIKLAKMDVTHAFLVKDIVKVHDKYLVQPNPSSGRTGCLNIDTVRRCVRKSFHLTGAQPAAMLEHFANQIRSVGIKKV